MKKTILFLNDVKMIADGMKANIKNEKMLLYYIQTLKDRRKNLINHIREELYREELL